MSKKLLCLFIACIFLITGILTACSASPATDDGNEVEQTPAEEESEQPADEQVQEAEPEEATLSTQLPYPVKFTYMRPVWGPATHEKGSDYEKILFEKANVEIESIIVPVIDYEAKFPTMIAGGNIPDVVWHAGPQWGVAHDLIEQGAFLPLDEYLEKYPAVKNAISDYLWDLVKSPDGKHYFFPMPLAPWVPFPLYYRKDWFDKLNIPEPTTIDELVEALKIIRDSDPDGNGKNDTVPLTAHEYTLWYFKEVGTAFGYVMGSWVPDPDDPNPDNPQKIVPSDITPNAKEFLGWLQMLRRENLIDPDYLIAKGKQGADKFMAGQAAVIVGHWGGYLTWTIELKKIDPEAEVGVMPLLEGPRGRMGARGLSGFDRGFSIAASAKDKADDIFKFLNWVYTEGYEFMKWGVEGEMYTVDENGEKIPIQDEERKPGFQGPNVEPFGFPLKSDDTIPTLGQDWKAFYDVYKANGLEDKVDMIRKMFEDMAANTYPDYNRNTYSETGGEKGSQIQQQYLTPMQEKIAIDPNAPLSLFDEAVQNWLNAGGQQIIDEVNAIQTDKSKPILKYEYTGRDYR